jgi:CyaY protein
MSNSEFIEIAAKTIASIVDMIEEQDKDCLIDIDFQGDILSLSTDHGTFVINTQTAAKEIWLSSPISGPHHFFYEYGIWKTRNNLELNSILNEELQIKLNI